MKTKKYYLLPLLLLLTLLLSACACDHEWQASTCLAPRTCTRCGATEGKLRAHDYGSTACNDPKPCTVCGTTEGIELTHTWRSDCKICIYCGQDERPADDRFMDSDGISGCFRAEYGGGCSCHDCGIPCGSWMDGNDLCLRCLAYPESFPQNCIKRAGTFCEYPLNFYLSANN